MLEEPPFPEKEWDIAIQLCLSDDKVVAYVNPPALASLLWDFWYLAAKLPRGEDISVSSVGELLDTPGCFPLGNCEITLTGEGPVMGHLHNPVAEFCIGNNEWICLSIAFRQSAVISRFSVWVILKQANPLSN